MTERRSPADIGIVVARQAMPSKRRRQEMAHEDWQFLEEQIARLVRNQINVERQATRIATVCEAIDAVRDEFRHPLWSDTYKSAASIAQTAIRRLIEPTRQR